MSSETIEIIKQKDGWKFTVEIKENAKGEPSVTVKSRSDEAAKNAGDEAIALFEEIEKLGN